MVMQMIQVSQMHYTKQIHIAKDAPSSTRKWYAAIHVTFWNCWQSPKALTLCGYSSY